MSATLTILAIRYFILLLQKFAKALIIHLRLARQPLVLSVDCCIFSMMDRNRRGRGPYKRYLQTEGDQRDVPRSTRARWAHHQHVQNNAEMAEESGSDTDYQVDQVSSNSYTK